MLAGAGVPVVDVAEITGLPAVLGHRVVTLAPQIHGGLMATEKMRRELDALGWPWIDLLCVDFYPLREAIRVPGATIASVLEKTDIGGPAMVRSAVKGGRIVIVDPADRQKVTAALSKRGSISEWLRRELCAKAERVVANYCAASAAFHESVVKADNAFP